MSDDAEARFLEVERLSMAERLERVQAGVIWDPSTADPEVQRLVERGTQRYLDTFGSDRT